MKLDHFLWTEKYRPNKIADCVLPDRIKDKFQGFVDAGHVQHLILTGNPGLGKTTVARAMVNELDADFLMVNGSNERNIETLRNDIATFASSMSLRGGGRKYVILDEADYLNPVSTQPALRNFMETHAKNTSFILTCNFPHKLIEAIHSRCSVIDFKFSSKEKQRMAGQMLGRIQSILSENNIKYEKSVVADVIMKFFPDWRRCLNELQRASINGSLDKSVLINLGETAFEELIVMLKNKKYTDARKWLAEHNDIDTATLYRMFYTKMKDFIEPSSIPDLVIILAEHQHVAAFVADPEVNNAACLAKIMVQCSFK